MSDYDDDFDYDDDAVDYEYSYKTTYRLERKSDVLIVTQSFVTGVKAPDQDWGEADFTEEMITGTPDDYPPRLAAQLKRIGATMQAGQVLDDLSPSRIHDYFEDEGPKQ